MSKVIDYLTYTMIVVAAAMCLHLLLNWSVGEVVNSYKSHKLLEEVRQEKLVDSKYLVKNNTLY